MHPADHELQPATEGLLLKDHVQVQPVGTELQVRNGEKKQRFFHATQMPRAGKERTQHTIRWFHAMGRFITHGPSLPRLLSSPSSSSHFQTPGPLPFLSLPLPPFVCFCRGSPASLCKHWVRGGMVGGDVRELGEERGESFHIFFLSSAQSATK